MYFSLFAEMDQVRVFKCKKMSYIWDPDRNEFYKLRGFDNGITTSSLHQHKGLSAVQQFLRYIFNGGLIFFSFMQNIHLIFLLQTCCFWIK